MGYVFNVEDGRGDWFVGDDCCHGWIIVLNEWMFC